jgi:hypothetical protein
VRLEHDARAARGRHEERDHEQHGRDQLDEHARAVDLGHQLHAVGVHRGREEDEERAEDDGVRREVVLALAVAVDLEAVPDLRERELVGERDR